MKKELLKVTVILLCFTRVTHAMKKFNFKK